jgi:hypothetical protein
MMIYVNQKVVTPIGTGTVQGGFVIRDAAGHLVTSGVGVRLPVNETTQALLKRSNCITPGANVSGIWVFQESELK